MNKAENKPIRTFLAVRLPLDMAATLHKKTRHRVGEPKSHIFRWVVPQQQHITLKFLGNSTPVQLEGLVASLEDKLTHIPAFDVMTGRFDFFPDASRPRVLAVHMHSGRQLNRLATICEEAALLNGFCRERRNFRPHVTLARLKHHQHLGYSEFFTLPSFVMGVGEIVLMQSQPGEHGPVYKTLHTFPLQSLAHSA